LESLADGTQLILVQSGAWNKEGETKNSELQGKADAAWTECFCRYHCKKFRSVPVRKTAPQNLPCLSVRQKACICDGAKMNCKADSLATFSPINSPVQSTSFPSERMGCTASNPFQLLSRGADAPMDVQECEAVRISNTVTGSLKNGAVSPQ
jgi:hypothetical protein